MNTVVRRESRVVMIGLVAGFTLVVVGLLLAGRTTNDSSPTAAGSYSNGQSTEHPELVSNQQQATNNDVLTISQSAADARRSARQAKRAATTAKADASSAKESARRAEEAAAAVIAAAETAQGGGDTNSDSSAPTTASPTPPSTAAASPAGSATSSTPAPAGQSANTASSTASDSGKTADADVVTTGDATTPAATSSAASSNDDSVETRSKSQSSAAAEGAATGKKTSSKTAPSKTATSEAKDLVDPADKEKTVDAKAEVVTPAPSNLTNGMKNISSRGVLDTRGVKAFPGAEGGAQDATGGRGGQLVIVNSLECSSKKGDGKITLKEAWERTGDVGAGPAYIVFSVGGMIDCERNTSKDKSHIVIKDNTTTMCQTAPSPGINVGSFRTVTGNNSITVGCRLLNYDIAGDAASPFRGTTKGLKHSVMGHMLSGINTVDDFTLGTVLSNSNGYVHSMTLSDSLIAEGDAHSTHLESNTPNRYQHSHGAGCSAGQNVTRKRPVMDCWFIGNVFAHNNRRNPKFWSSSGGVVNNMMYNIGENGPQILQRQASEVDIYLTDNYFKHGPTSHRSKGQEYRVEVSKNSSARLFSRNNRIEHRDGKITSIPERSDNPKEPRRTFHKSMDWTNPKSFDCIGARYRDGNDERIINEILNGTGEIGIGAYGDPLKNDGDSGRHWTNAAETKANDYYKSSKYPASYDTDNDGMEDAWERANGLTVGTNDFWEDADNDGYANGEEHAHAKARRCVQG